MNPVAEVGVPSVISSSANVFKGQCGLLGIFCASASGSPTVAVYDDAGTGTSNKIVDTFVPVAGTYYKLPAKIGAGVYVAIGATCSLTVFYAP